MPSLNKLAVLVLVILIVWFGARWFERLNAARRRAALRDERARAAAAERAPVATTELTRCPACGVYAARGTVCACGANLRR